MIVIPLNKMKLPKSPDMGGRVKKGQSLSRDISRDNRRFLRLTMASIRKDDFTDVYKSTQIPQLLTNSDNGLCTGKVWFIPYRMYL